ncbi:Crp/Fnr family transcriptional regulator [Paenibacillus spiritus]|uniref:Crp/Fnr family transcriptional regulator n=1 Tax=Paenibacillus spiritus TaxID=2496557 RepID=A0A5J5GDF4_9BACL|nr:MULTISPECIES: Crp/Fnr family transcriptional regulator [Paenibacillus]KAA9005474.1 Crp/Fnr family transcriptional regulator [Paenibacillus spiritus]
MVTIKVPESLYPYFQQAGNSMGVRPGERIYMQGDQANRLYLITKGRVRVYCISKEGEELTIEIVEKGRIFGESSFLYEATRQTTVDAVNEVELVSCTLESLSPYLNQSKELTFILFQLLSSTCSHLSHQLKRSNLYNRYEKVASFLLDETVYPNKDKGIRENCIPYSHEELAVCLGLNRVTVTKVLNDFKQRGWIDLQYKKVIILNRAALSEFIGF